MPDEVRDVLGKYIDELDQRLDPNTPARTARRQRSDEEPAPLEGWLPPLASSGAASQQPPGEKIAGEIGDHLQGQVDRTVDGGLDRLEQGFGRISEGLKSFQSGVESRVEEGLDRVGRGLDKIEGQIDAGLDRELESPDFSRWLAEPDGTSTLVALPGYRVSTADVLKLREARPAGAGEGSIDGLYRVAGDGSIDLGRHGKLNVAGKRLADVEREIEGQLARFTPGADVLLDVAAAERDVYYVIAGRAGQGGNVWRVRATGLETIEDAIRAAGSPPQAIETIWLAHPSTWGHTSEQLIPVQWDAGRGRATPNYRIAPGDAVFFSERNSPWSGQAQRLVGAWLEWLRR